jgi:hypothetical protein
LRINDAVIFDRCFLKGDLMKVTYLFVIAATLATTLAWGKGDAQQHLWVKAQRSIEGDSTLYLSKQFSQKSGTFAATPESVRDTNTTVKGNFLVGSYKYVYDKPAKEAGHLVDEMLITELLRCKDSYFGTLSKVTRYKGKDVVSVKIADADVSMTQTSGPNISKQLCDLYSKGGTAGTAQKANPSYRGTKALTDKEVDKLIDKYK